MALFLIHLFFVYVYVHLNYSQKHLMMAYLAMYPYIQTVLSNLQLFRNYLKSVMAIILIYLWIKQQKHTLRFFVNIYCYYCPHSLESFGVSQKN